MGQLVFQATLGGAINLSGPNTASTVTFTLPSADGSSGQVMQTNGAGVLSLGTVPIAGGGTNGTATPTAGAISYGTGSAYAFTSAGTSGQVLTSAGASAPTWTTPISLSTANTWTATQTFNGTSSTFGAVLLNSAETATVSATAATGTIAYYLNSQSVLYYTSNASANWIVNFAFSSGTSLNTAMATGQSVTAVFLVTQGATAYYNSAVQIDGSAVTPKWQGGTAPNAGNASSIDVYTYTIVKTGSATYTVFASQTKFA